MHLSSIINPHCILERMDGASMDPYAPYAMEPRAVLGGAMAWVAFTFTES